jgi:UDP-glucose 4-epimerase
VQILLTGGAGYIGAAVARELEQAGHRLWIVDNFTTGHREACAVLQGSRVEWVEGDLGDRGLLESLLGKVAFDGCVHVAGSALVEESMAQPELYYRNNVACGLTLLDSLRRARVRSLVFSSSAAVYGAPRESPIEEEHPTCPTNVYGETKLAFERMLHWFHRAGGPGFLALRYFNAAGASRDGLLGETHEPETHLIPNLLAAALAGKPVTIFGEDYPTPDGTCVRDYVHLEDLARAHRLGLELLARENRGEAVNLGSGRGYSVKEVIAAVQETTGASLKVEVHPRREGDPPVLVASRRKAEVLLGWVPQFSEIGRILETAWAWHRRESRSVGAS